MKTKRRTFLISLVLILFVLNMKALTFADEKLDLAASASSYYSTNSADKAVDGDRRSYWIGGSDGAPWWIKLDAGKIVQLKEITLSWYYMYHATDFDIQVSRNGETWENVYTGLRAEAPMGSDIITPYTLNKEGRYVRIYIRRVRRNSPIIPEIEIYALRYAPPKIRFQGRLKDVNGYNINEPLKLTFKIYDVEIGGIPLWSEIQQNIQIKEGILDVILGSVNELNLSFDKQYYLGVEVEQDGEMAPRFEMTSVPYAFSSEK